MVILSKFAENLSELMHLHTISAPALGKLLGISRTNITRYKQGKYLPGYEHFIKLLEYFDVSADVLLGRLEYSEAEKFLPVQPFSVRLREAMDETHKTQADLQRVFHYSSATTNAWLKGTRIPTVVHLDELADYMEVSVDYLLGRVN